MFFVPRTHQPALTQALHYTPASRCFLEWTYGPVPLVSRETLPTVLSTAPRVNFSVPGQHCHVVIPTRDLLHRVGKKEIQLQGLKHFRAISLVNTNASIIVRAKGVHLALI